MQIHDKWMKFNALFREQTCKSFRFQQNTTGELGYEH